MQSILREKLLSHAMKLSGVSNIYRTESHRFVEAYYMWLEEAEKDLSALRSPISVILQSEKSSLLSVMDGNLPGGIQEGKSIRKHQKAAAAQSMEKVSREMVARIESIDNSFEQMGEKLCHAVAVIGSKNPEFYTQLRENRVGIDMVRRILGSTPETVPMYNYLSAKLASTDINYLLADILTKIKNNSIDIG